MFIKSFSKHSRPGYCTQDKYDSMRQRRNKRIKARRKNTKYKANTKPGCRPLSRLHPDHPKRKEFEGRMDSPNFEAPKNQEFVP